MSVVDELVISVENATDGTLSVQLSTANGDSFPQVLSAHTHSNTNSVHSLSGSTGSNKPDSVFSSPHQGVHGQHSSGHSTPQRPNSTAYNANVSSSSPLLVRPIDSLTASPHASGSLASLQDTMVTLAAQNVSPGK